MFAGAAQRERIVVSAYNEVSFWLFFADKEHTYAGISIFSVADVAKFSVICSNRLIRSYCQ